jgi:hypothetical protein
MKLLFLYPTNSWWSNCSLFHQARHTTIFKEAPPNVLPNLVHMYLSKNGLLKGIHISINSFGQKTLGSSMFAKHNNIKHYISIDCIFITSICSHVNVSKFDTLKNLTQPFCILSFLGNFWQVWLNHIMFKHFMQCVFLLIFIELVFGVK